MVITSEDISNNYSLQRVKSALKWLKKNNPLYTGFFAHCETILPYLSSV